MTGIYVLLIILILLALTNVVLLVGVGIFLFKLGAALKQNRENTAGAIDDISTMVGLIRSNFEELKHFIRSLVSS